MEIGYAILCVVKQGKASITFEHVGMTVSQLALTNVLLGTEAVNTYGITPEMLRETGVPLDEALKTLKNNIDAAKGKEQVRSFLRANDRAGHTRAYNFELLDLMICLIF